MNSTILKYGLYAGAGTIAYLLLFYSIGPKVMLNTWVSWSSLLIYIAAMIKATIEERNAAEGHFSFRLAVRPAFGVYVLASVVYFLFNYIMYNYVNADLPEIQREVMVEQSQFFAERLGKQELADQMENIKADDLRVSVRNSALGFMWSLIGGFVLSMIIGLALKRER